jgi:hypothetical protein
MFVGTAAARIIFSMEEILNRSTIPPAENWTIRGIGWLGMAAADWFLLSK